MKRIDDLIDIKCHVVSTYVTPSFFKLNSVGTIEETLDKILNGDRVCVSRYGDGEFKIMFGGWNGFQARDKKLKRQLRRCVKMSNREGLLVCIPDFFDKDRVRTEEARNFWLGFWRVFSFKICRRLNLKGRYYNAHVTRPYMDYADKENKIQYFKKMQALWQNKDVLIVEGEASRLGVGNDLFDNAKSIERILCPAKNAFSRYDEILSAVKSNGKDKLILLALGPTASVLAVDLYKAGLWAIDIGHIDIEYEWCLLGVCEKVAVKGKFVKEVEEGNVVEDTDNSVYLSQIIKKIL